MGRGESATPISGNEPIVQYGDEVRNKSLADLGDQNWISLQVCKLGHEIEKVWGSAKNVPAQCPMTNRLLS